MIKLWNQTMPHRCVEDAFEPYLTPYDCDAAKTAIVVCPGGAYCGRADYEGNDVGAWLNTIGITAFVCGMLTATAPVSCFSRGIAF